MTREIRITKMSGAGNDFVVLGPEASRALGGGLAEWAKRICRRGLSVGADGVLSVAPAGAGRVRVDFLNPDGRPAFCGNGSRCAARYARLRGFADEAMVLETSIGEIPATVSDPLVSILLPTPEEGGRDSFESESERIEGWRVLAGVPHFVVVVADLERAPLSRWGPILRAHPRFGPEGTNVDCVAWRPDGKLGIRTWERGVEGETLSCGTGALAAAWVAREGRSEVDLVPASGVALRVAFEQPGRRVLLEGDARVVFEGSVGPEAIGGFPSC